MGFNRVSLLGRLVRDVDVRYNDNGIVIGQFTLAVDRPKRKGNEKAEADFIRCVAFGKLAETLGNYVSKGQRLFVDGAIHTGSYTSKKTGQTVYATDVYVNGFEFIDKQHGGSNAAAGVASSSTSEAAGTAPADFSSMGQAVVEENAEINF